MDCVNGKCPITHPDAVIPSGVWNFDLSCHAVCLAVQASGLKNDWACICATAGAVVHHPNTRRTIHVLAISVTS